MLAILIVSIIIVLVVLFLAVSTTSKAYQYKHTVDDLEENPHLNHYENEENSDGK
ncbi:YtzI protein [Bacillus timonensis]|uniref:YtzI protein n=1 Tax=Bacillus timonensis TaxID=1033734 RepID=A0A4S3PYU7_9BACI|nr:YtzI protein [Bacillus timonensis]THE14844.1 YtzI protein [Bacillus timonensis]